MSQGSNAHDPIQNEELSKLILQLKEQSLDHPHQ
jgi:hypothetical protein